MSDTGDASRRGGKSDTVYGYLVVGLLTIALITVGALWLLERRQSAHLAETMRQEREIAAKNALILRRLFDQATTQPAEQDSPEIPPVGGGPAVGEP